MGHLLEKLDWTDVRYFVVVADAGSFLKAATMAGIAINTLRRSIDRLEDQLGYALFVRSGEGARLTHEGRRLVVAARDMEKSFADVVRVASAAANSLAGPVRVDNPDDDRACLTRGGHECVDVRHNGRGLRVGNLAFRIDEILDDVDHQNCFTAHEITIPCAILCERK